MSHFAKIDSNNIVENVIVAEQDFINSGAIGDAFLWVQTSYNGNFRGKYASIGDTWNKVEEIFISPRPYPSWSLDNSFNWQAPTAHDNQPSEGNAYTWNEDTLAWIEVTE